MSLITILVLYILSHSRQDRPVKPCICKFNVVFPCIPSTITTDNQLVLRIGLELNSTLYATPASSNIGGHYQKL